MPTRSRKASAWNSLCAPLPIKAMRRLPGRASRRATNADVAAVRMAAVMVSSDSSRGAPVARSASTPKAITVGRPARVFPGWPLTYLKAKRCASAIGNRHQLNHPLRAMAGHTGARVKVVPAQKVLLNARGNAGDTHRQALALHQADHVRGAEVGRGGVRQSGHGAVAAGSDGQSLDRLAARRKSQDRSAFALRLPQWQP